MQRAGKRGVTMAQESSSSDNVLPLKQPTPQLSAETANHTILFISFWTGVLNARLLAITALVGALGIFGYTIGDPTNLRLWGCAGYAIGILWPVIWLYLKKGN